MALSPVVTHTVEAAQPQSLGRAISSPLKNVTSQTSSSNGTPMPPVTSAPAPTSIPTTLDLAEQMNDEEKRKYVKGMVQHWTSEVLL
jgi:cyclin-dependent kinase 7